jgi:5-methylcytosine-specific restriction protein A
MHTDDSTALIDKESFDKDFEAKVAESQSISSQARQKRLSTASKMPERVPVVSTAFRRNPDVVAEVLARAKGHCEECKMSAPFLRARDNTPYLEIHHKVTLADGGEDAVENAFALCPNCHRRLHFG